MIPLLEPYSDLKALYAAIVASPSEDTPRLAFADEALDVGDRNPRILDWASFIQMQFERELIGFAPFLVRVDSVEAKGGRDSFAFQAGEESRIKLGDRIDVEETHLRGRSKTPRRYPSLKVTRTDPADSTGLVEVTAIRDSDSIEFPRERRSELTHEIRRLLHENFDSWFPCIPPCENRCFEYRRGFLSKLSLGWSFWEKSGKEYVASMPLIEIALWNVPRSFRPTLLSDGRHSLSTRWPSILVWNFEDEIVNPSF